MLPAAAVRAVALVLVALLTTACGGAASPGAVETPSPTSAPTAIPTAIPTPTPTPTPSPTGEQTAVDVYLPNDERGDPCTEVFARGREVPAEAPLRGALEALLAGPTDAEKTEGYAGWFSDDTADLLDDVALADGRAEVSFDTSLPQVIPNASSSCGSSLLLAQLDRTVLQFPTVREVLYTLDGDAAAFYEWLQLSVPEGAAAEAPREEGSRPASEASAVEPTSRAVPASLRGGEWEHLPTRERLVALTFDAGANADGVPAILETLAATGTPATFFLTGAWVDGHPQQARTIGASYPVGNHTRSHPDLTTLSDAEVRDQIQDAQDTIRAVAGRDPRPWFRFPFGARNARTIGLVGELGYGSVRWSVDTLGWQGTSGGRTAATVTERVLDDLGPGQIVLLHVGSHPEDGSTLDADALPEIIRRIRAAGYRFVDLDALLT